jgi:transposase
MKDIGLDLKSSLCSDPTTKAFVPREARWVVERTFAWLANWRRLIVCYERDIQHYADFCWIAITTIVASRFEKTEKLANAN